MPRIKRGPEQASRPVRFPDLLAELVRELRADHPSGQPLIDEEHFATTDRKKVAVFWDKWDDVPHEERAEIILRAYETAEGPDYRNAIALAYGLTIPEAVEAGMLPVRVIPVLRRGDTVSLEDCTRAMVDEGASELVDPRRPPLRFATVPDAEASVGRLKDRLRGSDEVWSILEDFPQSRIHESY